MTLPPPKIDPRTYDELVAETEKLAQKFSQWKAPKDKAKADAGRALIRIFGRMASMVTDRLNRVPEKHFLAFLNLIGAQQQPPRPARVPLTAYLVDRSSLLVLRLQQSLNLMDWRKFYLKRKKIWWWCDRSCNRRSCIRVSNTVITV